MNVDYSPYLLDIPKFSWILKVSGCPMFVLSEKLKILKNNSNIWNKETFGNVHYLVSDVEDELHLVQAKIQFDGYSDNLSTMDKDCMNKLEEALQNEHLFWKEKAKVNWHLEDDRNNNFFSHDCFD